MRYVRRTIIPQNESCLVLIEAASEAHVREAYARANVHSHRISTAVGVEEPYPRKVRK